MVLERTVMSPFAGGPVYQWLRTASIGLRRNYARRPVRWLRRNWDFEKMAMTGVPELHLDPHKNGWRYYVDTSYYGGIMDKVAEDLIRGVFIYPIIAFCIYIQHQRWKDNNKYDVFSKWKKE
eukprot:GEMP01048413.1.p1 GENE.GEMP01048413.1~~GEMP01048413.1.p1  ORF type:complete len:131 (+),score=14.76 GEMP01048413.1:30-395(+)